jgi:hypothetical protein
MRKFIITADFPDNVDVDIEDLALSVSHHGGTFIVVEGIQPECPISKIVLGERPERTISRDEVRLAYNGGILKAVFHLEEILRDPSVKSRSEIVERLKSKML